jgi:hypothetical protein
MRKLLLRVRDGHLTQPPFSSRLFDLQPCLCSLPKTLFPTLPYRANTKLLDQMQNGPKCAGRLHPKSHWVDRLGAAIS